MAFNKDDFLAALDTMSVMDLNDLVKAIEEKFGVSAAAMSAPAAGGGAEAKVAGRVGLRADREGGRAQRLQLRDRREADRPPGGRVRRQRLHASQRRSLGQHR